MNFIYTTLNVNDIKILERANLFSILSDYFFLQNLSSYNCLHVWERTRKSFWINNEKENNDTSEFKLDDVCGDVCVCSESSAESTRKHSLTNWHKKKIKSEIEVMCESCVILRVACWWCRISLHFADRGKIRSGVETPEQARLFHSNSANTLVIIISRNIM